MVAILGLDKKEIHRAVQDMYTVVAKQPDTPLHFPIGAKACRQAGYAEEQLRNTPQQVLESFAGVGCPFGAEVIKAGDIVLDVGSGSGTDVFTASRLVGEYGKVWAMDFTPAMRTKLQSSLDENDIKNVEVIAGNAEHIPLPDASIDVVTSNGVLNLVIDKRQAIAELFRVLKPGGYAQIADIVIAAPVTPDCEDDPKLWAECVVGATVDENYITMFKDAGFYNIEILRDYDYFANSPSKETLEVARQFGAHAYELRMQRSPRAPAKAIQWAKRLDPRRAFKNLHRRGLWGTLSLFLSALACYGTLALTGLFSLMGITIAVNNGVWAGSIMVFAISSSIIIALGIKKHHSVFPIVLAGIGVVLIGYTMLVKYSALIEFCGFVFLSIAAYKDFDLRRWTRVKGGKKRGRRETKDASRPEIKS
jgi:arsenite methyltransferase